MIKVKNYHIKYSGGNKLPGFVPLGRFKGLNKYLNLIKIS